MEENDQVRKRSGRISLPEGAAEVHIVALMTVKELLGWSEKTVLFSGKTVAEFLRQFTTKDGDNLYEVLVDEDGMIRPEYMVRLNNRPVGQHQRAEIPIKSGDRVMVMPVMKFAAGG